MTQRAAQTGFPRRVCAAAFADILEVFVRRFTRWIPSPPTFSRNALMLLTKWILTQISALDAS